MLPSTKIPTAKGSQSFKKLSPPMKSTLAKIQAEKGEDTIGLEDELAQFTGTTQYYRNFTGLLYTDGVHFLAERAKAYWLIDLVGSYQPRLKHMPFQFWEMKVERDKSALVTMVEDIGKPVLVKQEIPYTDFPLTKFSFYVCSNVMMLKSEY